jgi:hypothetical protein
VQNWSKLHDDIITPAILSVALGKKTADVALKDAATQMDAELAATK